MTRSRITFVALATSLVAVAVAALGCNDECARSQDREIECVGSHNYDAGAAIDCTGVAECAAQCINNADGGPTPDCDTVVAFLHGDKVKAKVIFDCIDGCSAPVAPGQ